MKTKLLIAITILFSIFLFVSCNEPNINENGNNENIPPLNDDEITVALPFFGQIETVVSRGITQMPIELFKACDSEGKAITGNGDLGIANAVMTTMPVMTRINPVKISLGKLESNIRSNYSAFTVFGFRIKLVPEKIKLNPDGFYLPYEIYDEKGTKVGFADYYYSTENKSFTYRQSEIVTIPMEPHHNDVNLIIATEFDDIKITDFNCFTTGQFDSASGMLMKDAFCDTLNLDHGSQEIPNGYRLNRKYITMKSDKDIIAAFSQPDCLEITDCKKWSESEHKSIFESVAGTDYIINSLEERSNANFDFLMNMIELMYSRGSSIKERKAYSSYNEFMNDSIKEFKHNGFITIDSRLKGQSFSAPMPTIYDPAKGIGASTSIMIPDDGGYTMAVNFTNVQSKKRYLDCGFGYFYKLPENEFENPEKDYADYLMECHLKACGIIDERYIEAFKEETHNADSKHFVYNEIKVSN